MNLYELVGLTNIDLEHIPNVIPVAGVVAGNKQGLIKYLTPNTKLHLKRDPFNAYDPYAIGIHLANGTQVGWVPKEHAKNLAPELDMGLGWDAALEALVGGGEKSYGLRVRLIPIH